MSCKFQRCMFPIAQSFTVLLIYIDYAVLEVTFPMSPAQHKTVDKSFGCTGYTSRYLKCLKIIFTVPAVCLITSFIANKLEYAFLQRSADVAIGCSGGV